MASTIQFQNSINYRINAGPEMPRGGHWGRSLFHCQDAFKSAPNLMWTTRSRMNADPRVQDGNY